MSNKKALSYEDFLILWAQAVGHGVTPTSTRKYLEGLHKLILDELKLNDELAIYNIGKLYLRQTGGRDALMGDPINGGTIRRYIKPQLDIEFEPSIVLKREINDNEFQREKPKSRKPRKYATNKDAQIVRNEKRRKPKPSIESTACDMLNEAIERKKKKNGETNTDN